MKITILGGGNIGMCLLGEISQKADYVPNELSGRVAAFLEDMLSIKCETLSNYMCVTFLPGIRSYMQAAPMYFKRL